jgi:hypothetical protein
MDEYFIAGRFRGPPGTGNGGYVAGRAALLLGSQPAEVTLRRPVPLDRALRVTRPDGRVEILDDEGTLILEAHEAPLELEVPAAPSVAEAEAATNWFLGSGYSHSTGLCFCCGSARPEGEGLRVFTGKVAGRPGVSAAVWRPDAAYAGADGKVAPEYLWTALDCPGAFAFTLGEAPMRTLLGRLTARLQGSVAVGEPCIVMGWQIAREGRKLHAGSAIFGADGGLRGLARALWVVPAPVAA